MPSRLFFFTRNKVVHTQGVVTQVKLVPSGNSHPFTGMFRGADYGIMRMSLATKPTISVTDTTKNNLVPAIGLKLLRSGVESANVVLIGSRDGQTSENFFANPLSNHIPATSDKTALKLLSK